MKQQKQKVEKKRLPVKKVPEKPKPKPKLKRTPKPEYKWATGQFERFPEIRFILPWQFLYSCKLLGVPPTEVLNQFITDVSCDSWRRNPNDNVRTAALNYFIQCGYGQNFYTEEDIRQMFREMDTVANLWPKTDKTKLISLHAKWRNKYLHFWFKKWYHKVRRKD